MAPGERYLPRFPGQEPNVMFVISFKVFAWQVAQKMTAVCRKPDAEESMALGWSALVPSAGRDRQKTFIVPHFPLGIPLKGRTQCLWATASQQANIPVCHQSLCPVLQKRSRRGKEVTLCCSAFGR